MGILSSLFNSIPQYENNKQYGDYAVTPICRQWTAVNAKLNVKIILKQINDCTNICKTTHNPVVFFYRYDMLIKKTIELSYISQYVKITGASPNKLVKMAIEQKPEQVTNLINNTYSNTRDKILNLKTPKSKLNAVEKFKSDFEPFLDEMNDDNKHRIDECGEMLKQLCE